ncbi:hypothetical protein [Scytonema sp. PCC 10023]|uniref:hypothetical protein n=1 Tax=Scytonema sp. PCC 10023 TaxID=1680591 RepID=UPI0039C5F57E
MINIEEQLDSLLLRAEIIDNTTYTYLKLRSQSPVTPSPVDAFAIIDNNIGYRELFAAMCNLAQKRIINFRFPRWRVQLYNNFTKKITEAEVRRSLDTVGLPTYIYNAIKAEQWIKYGTPLFIDSAFMKKWNLSDEQMIANFSKVINVDLRFLVRDFNDTLDFTWNPEASVIPSEVSLDDIKLIKSQAGTSKNLYIFWLLQYQASEDGGDTINLNAIARASGVPTGDFISALASLKRRGMVGYSLDLLTINWLSDISVLLTNEAKSLSKLFKPEALMAYKLKQLESNTVNIKDFCTENGLISDTFYANLKKLKASGILNYSAGESNIFFKDSSNWTSGESSSRSSSDDE